MWVYVFSFTFGNNCKKRKQSVSCTDTQIHLLYFSEIAMQLVFSLRPTWKRLFI